MSEAGAHCRLLTVVFAVFGVTVTVTVEDVPLRVAVTITVWLEVTVPAFAVKFAVVDPLGTVTDAGTDKAGLFPERLTTAPPLGAGCERVIEHVDESPEVTDEGWH